MQCIDIAHLDDSDRDMCILHSLGRSSLFILSARSACHTLVKMERRRATSIILQKLKTSGHQSDSSNRNSHWMYYLS
jgi:hypothetical protein